MTPRVFTVAPGLPFLPALLDAIDDGLVPGLSLAAPDLAEATFYLPTQRAARAFKALLAERGGGAARLLPRIVALGELDDGELEVAAALEGAEPLDPPIAPLERRLILARLVQQWASEVDRSLLRHGVEAPLLVPGSPADAVALAADLEGLMDALTTESVPWAEIAAAVETDYSFYFRLTLDFVRVASEHWPAELKKREASDPARRRQQLLAAEARRLAEGRSGPVIAAGSTGSIPATAALIAAIARLPQGAVVLPGLDLHLEEPAWAAIGDPADPVPGHPQAMLHRLLTRHLDLPRDAVRVIGQPTARGQARAALLSEALRPAATTDLWAAMPAPMREALAQRGGEGIALVEAADEREEALSVALALREALEREGTTAALVTPDRALATRVAGELARWGVEVEDSAGCPLADTAAGRLARLAADLAAADAHPLQVIALLAHPLVTLGLGREAVERGAAALELGVLRGPAPGPGFPGLRRAFREARRAGGRLPLPRARLAREDWHAAAQVLARLARAFRPFAPPADGGELCLIELADRHRAALAHLTEGAAAEQAPDAEALEGLFDGLAAVPDRLTGAFRDYPAFFAALARGVTVTRAPRAAHRRVKILGLLEARLLDADRVVLAGLDEGTWPPSVKTDAFLNRPMRHAIGLSPPERRIGQTAHDFVQALVACPDIILTRARKRLSAPQVPSRLLQRLRAFMGERSFGELARRGERWRALAQALEAGVEAPPAPGQPAPRPDPRLFPESMSVTEVETLLRDPYAVFARRILRLEALPAVAEPPGAAERGTLLHGVLARFARAHPAELPAEAEAILLQMGQDAYGPIEEAYPEVYAAWWPRFERVASAFLDWERERRDGLTGLAVEVRGRWALPGRLPRPFTLTARADRIERHRDGAATILDYKTGRPPSDREVALGFAPQLTLEAAMLAAGAFEGLPAAGGAPRLLYLHASGGREPFKPCPVKPPAGESSDGLVRGHVERLAGVVAAYQAGARSYTSRPFAKYARSSSDYDHLARVREWSLAAEEAEG